MTYKTNPDWLWDEPTYQCKYCGKEIKTEKKYCSDDCQKKDSVWHSTD